MPWTTLFVHKEAHRADLDSNKLVMRIAKSSKVGRGIELSCLGTGSTLLHPFVSCVISGSLVAGFPQIYGHPQTAFPWFQVSPLCPHEFVPGDGHVPEDDPNAGDARAAGTPAANSMTWGVVAGPQQRGHHCLSCSTSFLPHATW